MLVLPLCSTSPLSTLSLFTIRDTTFLSPAKCFAQTDLSSLYTLERACCRVTGNFDLHSAFRCSTALVVDGDILHTLGSIVESSYVPFARCLGLSHHSAQFLCF